MTGYPQGLDQQGWIKIGAASRRYVESAHDIDRVADRLLDLYRFST